jgi:hypothetical protein
VRRGRVGVGGRIWRKLKGTIKTLKFSGTKYGYDDLRSFTIFTIFGVKMEIFVVFLLKKEKFGCAVFLGQFYK